MTEDGTAPVEASQVAPAERAALEDRRANAIQEMVETQRQLDAGEIDEKTAQRLFAIHQARIVEAVDGLTALGPAPAAPDRRNQHRIIAGVGIASIALFVGLLVVTDSGHKKSGSNLTTGTTAPAASSTAGVGGGRDLSTVTNDEMEAVIAQNPNVTAMRLALVERYMSTGTESDLKKASEHAHVALSQNPGTTDRARALRDLGWVTALQGNPTEGAKLLDQSLSIEPTDKNTMFFLARVRLDGLHDPPGAIRLLQQIMAGGIDDPDVKKTVQDEMAKAQAQIKP